MRAFLRLSLLACAALLASADALALQTELTGVVQLSARAGHACVVTTAGGVKCWGTNSHGQLGGGPLGVARPVATDVVGLASGALSVAASTGAHSCAVVSGGGIKCWGLNASGQLGDGTTTNRATPVDVQALPWPAVAVTAGLQHTCARSAAGAVACWGLNSFGQLGDGTLDIRLAATPVSGMSSGVAAISAAGNHTCALLAGGAAKCWGANESGQLGDGTTTSSPLPVAVAGLPASSGIATGGHAGAGGPLALAPRETSCALAASGAKCWDAGGPVDVAGIAAGATGLTLGGGFIQTPFGSFLELHHACVLTAAGGARCWGQNYCGMLGNAAVVSCSSSGSYPFVAPVDVAGLASGVASVSAAAFFTCALLDTGQVECWGSGYGGTPAPAMQGTNPQAITFDPAMNLELAVGGTGLIVVKTSGDSGVPVLLTSLTPGTCSLSGNVVTGASGGTCTIAADQAGDAFYDPAPQVTYSFPVDPRLAQAITFGPAPTLVVNGLGSVSATASSGLPVKLDTVSSACSVSMGVVTGLGAGLTCTIVATQTGDSAYAPASAILTFPVGANTGSNGLAVYRSGGGTGTVTSAPAGIACGVSCAASFATSSIITLTAAADAGSTFAGWTGPCTGTGACVVTLDAMKQVDAVFDANAPRLANLSSRARVLRNNDVMIGGFVIGGTGYKTVVVRARGPSLTALGVPDALADPFLQVVRSSDGQTIAASNNWQAEPGAQAIAGLGFGSQSLDAAVLLTLAPGAYTAIVSGFDNEAGVGIVEIFEVDNAATMPLVNISTRAMVRSGAEVLIGGLIIQGGGPQTVVIRARGPSLAQFQVPNLLANPQLQLFAGDAQIGFNDNWQEAANAAEIQASGFVPLDPLESAIMVTLPPGAYTAIVTGVGGTTGNAIVEVFRVP